MRARSCKYLAMSGARIYVDGVAFQHAVVHKDLKLLEEVQARDNGFGSLQQINSSRRPDVGYNRVVWERKYSGESTTPGTELWRLPAFEILHRRHEKQQQKEIWIKTKAEKCLSNLAIWRSLVNSRVVSIERDQKLDQRGFNSKELRKQSKLMQLNLCKQCCEQEEMLTDLRQSKMILMH